MLIDHDFKGFPPLHPPLPLSAIGAQGWQLLRGDLALPLAVLREDALRHNLAWMRDFCAERGLSLAPHGKTSMSPELWALQREAGAWGLSVATAWQAAQAARHGMPRIIIANQVVQAAELDTLSGLLDRDPGLRLWFLVDSIAQVALIEAWQAARGTARRFDVLLELGLAGQRTGTRGHDEALALGQRIAASPALRLAGLECYEGALATCNDAIDVPAVNALMDRLDALARALLAEQAFDSGDEPLILSAGGSSVFDLVSARLQPELGVPVRGVLRSGCYLTHDQLHYHRHLQCLGLRLRQTATLQPALEVLAAVQSVPEPGLALLGCGKRDVSFDMDLPLPLWRARVGDAVTQAAPAHWQISRLNDQHAYLRFDASAAEAAPRVGDLVGLGISHPCTTFDKWRWLPLVDSGYRVTGAVTTRF
ncbi:alanine racemase [Ideonella sp. 4Y11]|uniref:Alanine racemase n=1 Tax=Ideonella aquatica TaxID=2824119 RepID=A0A940YVP5_9BURK|nr:alanine racemase [Ideonella aquatica]MBQ0960115.1 alanine racemase [Ideonella aquatica]